MQQGEKQHSWILCLGLVHCRIVIGLDSAVDGVKSCAVLQKIPWSLTKNKSGNKSINGTTSQIIQLHNYNWATTGPLWPNKGGKREMRRDEVCQRKEEWKKIDFKNERLPRCLGGLWLQCCTLHLFTEQRMTHIRQETRRRERCCLQNAVISNNIVTVP